jgi:hypothetical protein
MLVIGNNCCGGMFYRLHKIPFNNPFTWAVCPYRGIKYIMEHLYDINWANISLSKSKIRKNTFVITVDNKFPIHYVHYKFNPAFNVETVIVHNSNKDDDWSSDVASNHIWEYVVNKYIERTKRMINANEQPVFLLHDETYDNANYNVSLKDLAYHHSPYKRIVITADKTITRNDDICKTILTSTRNYPKPSVRAHFDTITDFFNQ